MDWRRQRKTDLKQNFRPVGGFPQFEKSPDFFTQKFWKNAWSNEGPQVFNLLRIGQEAYLTAWPKLWGGKVVKNRGLGVLDRVLGPKFPAKS